MAIIKTFSCVVIFLKILACLSQLHNTNPKLLLGKPEARYLSSSMEASSEEDTVNSEQELKVIPFVSWSEISSPEEQLDHEGYVIEVNGRRVKRRIFPGVGKALDRDRGGRNPWIRGRESFDEPHRTNTAFKRSGPMGSDLLYALYPDLAPSNWADPDKPYADVTTDTHLNLPDPEAKELLEDIEKKYSKKERDVDESALTTLEYEVTDVEPSPVTEAPTHRAKERRSKETIWSAPKKRVSGKGKIPKKLKENIAIYAAEHGANAAVSFYKGKLDFDLRRGAVEKYLMRYRRRKERKRLRSLIQS